MSYAADASPTTPNLRLPPDPELDDRLRRAIRNVTRAPPERVERLLESFPLEGQLESATEREIRRFANFTFAQARKLHEAFALVRAVEAHGCRRRGRRVSNPMEAGMLARSFIRNLVGMRQEVMVALALDSRLRLIEGRVVAVGDVAQVDLHPRELFRAMISIGAHSVLLAHNHPSGDPTPSDSDYELTWRMAEVGRLVGIPVVDHVVVVEAGCHSIRQLDPCCFDADSLAGGAR